MIKIENLYKQYDKLEVLKGITFDIKNKGIVSILGPNGSGKTTLIKSILGMVIPNKGDIFINNNKILKEHNYRKDISYLPQIANFPNNLTVIELINMIKNLRNVNTTEKHLIKLFKLEPHLNKKLRNLSGGTKQKVNIVLTFMFDSPYIILDEPTTGLDPISTIHLKDLIIKAKKDGKIILLTSHIMSFVEEISDEIIFILEGKVYFRGGVENLKKKSKVDNFEKSIAYILEKEL